MAVGPIPRRARHDRRSYDGAVKISPQELAERLAKADHIRLILRQATLDLRAAGERILSKRQRGSQRSDHGRADRG